LSKLGVLQYWKSRLAVADLPFGGSFYVIPTSKGAACVYWTRGAFHCLTRFVGRAGPVHFGVREDDLLLNRGGSERGRGQSGSGASAGLPPENSLLGLVSDDVVGFTIEAPSGETREATIDDNVVYADLAGWCVPATDLEFHVELTGGDRKVIPASKHHTSPRNTFCEDPSEGRA
jgi:hypothetical protein